MHDSNNNDFVAGLYGARMRKGIFASELQAEWQSEYGIETETETDFGADMVEEKELAVKKEVKPQGSFRR